MKENTDILFLVGSVYGFGMDEHAKGYIEHLNANNIKFVTVFCTSAIVKTGNQEMKTLLDAGDLKQTAAFAHDVMLK